MSRERLTRLSTLSEWATLVCSIPIVTLLRLARGLERGDDAPVCCSSCSGVVAAAAATAAATIATTTVAGRRRTLSVFSGCLTVAGASGRTTYVVWRLTDPARPVACRSRTVHGVYRSLNTVFCSIEYRSDYSDYIIHITMWQPIIPPRAFCRQRWDRKTSPNNTLIYLCLRSYTILHCASVRGVSSSLVHYSILSSNFSLHTDTAVFNLIWVLLIVIIVVLFLLKSSIALLNNCSLI